MGKYFISTAIPYVNGSPHAGHTLEYAQTDTIARYLRLKGHEVFFLSGTDENALKNVLAAEKEGKSTKEYVDENTEKFLALKELLNLSFDGFIRTTEKKHFEGTTKLWKALDPKDIYQDTYEGLYCVGCEEFKTEKELDENGECPEHKKKPEIVKEKNYFFKLSNYQDKIEELIKSDVIKIVPEKRKNEVLGFIREGLRDFSISRSNERARNWGVPVPNDPTQRIYVWLDALGNYITGLDYATNGELYQKFWEEAEERIHVIGKGIVKFHALYWVGMLLSAKLPLPTQEFVHGYVTVEGNKIGKSLGNAIDPKLIVDKYGVDAYRYYLLREIPAYGDGDFSWSRMDEVYKADLQNGLGNLVSRLATLAAKVGYSTPKTREPKYGKQAWGEIALGNYQFDSALQLIWEAIDAINKYVSDREIWKLNEESLKIELENIIFDGWSDRSSLLHIARSLKPFMPETAEKILTHFGKEKIEKIAPLFPRLS